MDDNDVDYDYDDVEGGSTIKCWKIVKVEKKIYTFMQTSEFHNISKCESKKLSQKL